MFKKSILAAMVVVMGVVLLAGCQKKAASGEALFFYSKDYKDISSWSAMKTPGGGEGSVTQGDNVAVIQAAEDGWGGIQSEEITLDLTKDPIILIQVKDNADEYKWGAKFVPSDPVVEDHSWGFYLIEDNNFKWDNYAGVDIKEKLGDEFIELYGESVKGVLWIYPSGGPDATVEISSVKMFNQK